MESTRNTGQYKNPTVFEDTFYFSLGSPPPGRFGGGSGLSFPLGDRRLWADSGPDPVENTIFIFILISALSVAGTTAAH